MDTNFIISGIDEDAYKHLFELKKTELIALGAIRTTADVSPGIPCRVSLKDAEVGEEVILFPYNHHRTPSPYQANGPVFIRKNALAANLKINEIPKMLNHRLLSLRVYNKDGMMIDAHTLEGVMLRESIAVILAKEETSYIQVHNAGPGCYNCQISRA